jgi:hypothetical protein
MVLTPFVSYKRIHGLVKRGYYHPGTCKRLIYRRSVLQALAPSQTAIIRLGPHAKAYKPLFNRHPARNNHKGIKE